MKMSKTGSIMKCKSVNNVFEAQSFIQIFSKVIGFNFITIKNENDHILGSTTLLNLLTFFGWLLFSVCLAIDTWRDSFDPSSNRSFIFEFLVAMTGKTEAFRSAIELFQIFIFRYKYLSILQGIHEIDEIVSFI